MYAKIELAAKANQIHSTGTSPTVMRQNVVNFMSYLRVYTHRYQDFLKIFTNYNIILILLHQGFCLNLGKIMNLKFFMKS